MPIQRLDVIRTTRGSGVIICCVFAPFAALRETVLFAISPQCESEVDNEYHPQCLKATRLRATVVLARDVNVQN